MIRFAVHSLILLIATALTQIGGLAWIVALLFRRRLIAFAGVYAALTVASVWIAPGFGRVALDCFDDGPLRVQSPLYCALNRTYVTPELEGILVETAEEMDRRFPGTVTLVLDANFPFLDGFPPLPHLSHDDGEKVDLAFFYADGTGYRPGATRSPIGYFAFEQGPTECSGDWPTLRWDLDMLQPFWRDYRSDDARNRAILRILSEDARVGRIFVEPHLVRALDLSLPDIRFQGCRAARHDDHIHLQLR
ncbi:penicillin-insensitive murein endopeptidase [Jannaschia sp. S6380]|uniref:penicillin-insensitive murein endopeptidase n=1 Tax=Jannaschia sp. S6380 TaxID=2926408 RepID=UPI001FF59124|nr:penicillin-insensitive murein endopeptidase [Jannaschia sp. S6380]MCK0168095.1 penicillin-insensitive murein endopeptidase [Jannaschia sp. S6380]